MSEDLSYVFIMFIKETIYIQRVSLFLHYEHFSGGISEYLSEGGVAAVFEWELTHGLDEVESAGLVGLETDVLLVGLDSFEEVIDLDCAVCSDDEVAAIWSSNFELDYIGEGIVIVELETLTESFTFLGGWDHLYFGSVRKNWFFLFLLDFFKLFLFFLLEISIVLFILHLPDPPRFLYLPFLGFWQFYGKLKMIDPK